MKKCSKCGRMLDESEFYAQSATKDGLQYNCKSCQMKRVKEYKSRPHDKYAAYCNKLAELSKEYNRLLGEAAHMLVESTGVEYSKALLEVIKRVELISLRTSCSHNK